MMSLCLDFLKNAFLKVFFWLDFIAVVIYEVIKSTLIVSRQASLSKQSIHSGIIKINLDIKCNKKIVLLSQVITLTPGTLTIGFSENVLYVHCLWLDENVKKEIKNLFERRIERLW